MNHFQQRARRLRRRLDDSGAAIVEAAIVTPVFVLLVFGVLEFGLAFRGYLTVSEASQSAARTIGIDGRAAGADRNGVTQIRDAMYAADGAQVQRIVVFHPDDATDDITASCKAGVESAGSGPDATDACNVYTFSQLADPLPQWDCDDPSYGPTAHSRPWCPQNRDDSDATADYVGVYVEYEHPYLTKLFGDTVTLESTSVIRIEPQSY